MTVKIILVWCCLYVAVLVGLMWVRACNRRTYEQRNRLIDFVYDSPGYSGGRVLFYKLVPYEAHFWCLVFFRNPKYLYHFSLWDGLE